MKFTTLVLGGLFAAVGAGCAKTGEAPAAAQPSASPRPAAATRNPIPAHAKAYRTDHYAISSTATPERTRAVGEAVESLHRAYSEFFRLPAATGEHPALKLILYRDRHEFSAYNTSLPWAEAYYRRPYCHAYYAGGKANPYHWMLHEATHQLNAEVAGIAEAKWMNEGLASYFGASRLRDGVLAAGSIDRGAYPIWWIADLPLSGNLPQDLRTGALIPLRDLIAGTGPAISGRYLNVYYIEYWSLSHFLFHYQGGRYARGYRRLLRGDGSLAAFEAQIGPIDRVQAEWYGYLLEKKAELGGDPESGWRVPIAAAHKRLQERREPRPRHGACGVVCAVSSGSAVAARAAPA